MSDIQSALNDQQKSAVCWLAKKRWCHLSKAAIIEKTKLSETEFDQLIAYLVRRGGVEAALTDDRTTFEDVYVLPEIQLLVWELNPSSANTALVGGFTVVRHRPVLVAALFTVLWLIWQAQ